MAECLECDDPVAALQLLANASALQAAESCTLLQNAILEKNKKSSSLHHTTTTANNNNKNDVPDILVITNSSNNNKKDDTILCTVAACADSVSGSLTKIASGGSQASQEIRLLEHQKLQLDQDAAACRTALQLRRHSDRAAQSLTAAAWADAADSVQPYLEYKQHSLENNNDTVDRVRQYTGEYSLQQLETVTQKLKAVVLQKYTTAVQKSDLATLGQLTPILSTLQLDAEAVALYQQFLQGILTKTFQEITNNTNNNNNNKNVVATMGRIYNAAVSVLRHHLPMVSHCLYKADGDAAVVQLVHVQTESAILPLMEKYQRQKQLAAVAVTAANIYGELEERYITTQESNTSTSLLLDTSGRGGGGGGSAGGQYHHDDDIVDDCGFARQIGSLPDVDAAMEETCRCLQHAVTYQRFVHHVTQEVNRARQLRFQQAQKQKQEQRRRNEQQQEWNKTDEHNKERHAKEKQEKQDDEDEDYYKEMEILPASTPLHEAVAEVGGQYASIERCLLLASMQRAFVLQATDNDARFYRPMSTLTSSTASTSSTSGSGSTTTHHHHHHHANNNSSAILQTTVVETCLYAARRGTQRAFCTGHAGTASAVTNFCVETLTDVLLTVLSRRAEDLGVAQLKPGDKGLLVMGGSAGANALFNNASNLLIRQSGVAGGAGVVGGVLSQHAHSSSAKHNAAKDEVLRKQKMQQDIARACAVMNDLEVAIHHIRQLENLLHKSIEQGFPRDTHETEQLVMCVKSLTPVAESFRDASDATIESLESVLKPRIRSIVGDAVGSDSSTFMGASSVVMVAGGGKASDRVMVRMNYNLDEETYNLMQLSEGYVTRLCSLLDELLDPLRRHLAPRLWDTLLLSVVSTACKRLETSLRKCQYTALGGLTLDSDMRDLLSYTKDHLQSPEYASNVAVFRACPALSRLLQISKLMSVDDLDDVLDLISSSKRKGNWDLKLEDAKAFLSARVEFDEDKVHKLLRLPDE